MFTCEHALYVLLSPWHSTQNCGGPCPVLCTKTILGQETDDEDDDDFFHQYLQEKKYTEANSFISCLMNL